MGQLNCQDLPADLFFFWEVYVLHHSFPENRVMLFAVYLSACIVQMLVPEPAHYYDKLETNGYKFLFLLYTAYSVTFFHSSPFLLCSLCIIPILYSIPVQMLAYHTAVIKGTDVDQPRNLAKSVTVE